VDTENPDYNFIDSSQPPDMAAIEACHVPSSRRVAQRLKMKGVKFDWSCSKNAGVGFLIER
jgi:hypothetical protein